MARAIATLTGKVRFSTILNELIMKQLEDYKKATGYSYTVLLERMIREYIQNHPLE